LIEKRDGETTERDREKEEIIEREKDRKQLI
jgi:hypothetical protein